MKHMLLFLLALLTSEPSTATAAEWISIHTTADQNQYFYDSSKLFLHDDEITYWKKVTFKTPQSFKEKRIASGLYRERIHCAEHTLKLISYLLYTPEGEVSEYTPNKEDGAAPIIPDSLGDVFEKALCPLVQKSKAESQQKLEAKTKAEVEEKLKLKAETGATVIVSPQPALPATVTPVLQD